MTQAIQNEGSGNIFVQAQGDGITVTIGLPHLTLVPVQRRLKHSQITSEIQLLDAYRRTIPVVGREQDMNGLWHWLHDGQRGISVRTLTGRAGAGKTRIAIELMLRLAEEQPGKWWTGFLTTDELRRFVGQQNLSSWGWGASHIGGDGLRRHRSRTAGAMLARTGRELCRFRRQTAPTAATGTRRPR